MNHIIQCVKLPLRQSFSNVESHRFPLQVERSNVHLTAISGQVGHLTPTAKCGLYDMLIGEKLHCIHVTLVYDYAYPSSSKTGVHEIASMPRGL